MDHSVVNQKKKEKKRKKERGNIHFYEFGSSVLFFFLFSTRYTLFKNICNEIKNI